jgi:hypothetical protein
MLFAQIGYFNMAMFRSIDSQEVFIQEEVRLNLLISNGDSVTVKSRSIPVRGVLLESEMVVAQVQSSVSI